MELSNRKNGTFSVATHGNLSEDKAQLFVNQSIFKLPQEDIVEYLENGGDATIMDFNGNTLAHIHPNLASDLVECGCDVNRLNNAGYSPLMTAIMSARSDLVFNDVSSIVLGDLIEATSKENLNRVYPNGETVLTSYLSKISMVLDEYEDGEILPILLKQGANPNTPNAKGQTPLDCCRASNKGEVVSMMIPYGLNVNAQNEIGKTLLMDALEQKDEKLAKVLLENGAHVKVGDKDGNTPLHYAARAGMTEMVVVLVKAGSQPWVPNKAGELPHSFAKGIAHEYLKMQALSCATDYKFHSGFTYNPAPQKIASQPVVGQTPDNQNTK
ncbi:MAG: ankyrin repeat domain-containing protein [Alphaproteobacteria bacterium]|nr:ankyrin repeat domain-containing protein [Alphaproteobacteria bacterium]